MGNSEPKINTVKKGRKPGPKKGTRPSGRQKGTPNKITRELKEMILGALDAKGGQKYLEQQAGENPGHFMALVGKILPKDINANVNVLDKLRPEDLATISSLIESITGGEGDAET